VSVPITTTYDITRRDLAAGYRQCLRAQLLAHRKLGFALVAMGLLALWTRATLLMVVGFLVVIGGIYVALRGEIVIRRAARAHFSPPHTVTITITDDELRDQSPRGDEAVPLTAFTSIRRSGRFWILRISRRKAVFMPLWALDEAQTAAFVELVRSMGTLEPG